jgi:hypothetical protein
LPAIAKIASHVAPVGANVFRVTGNFLAICSQNRSRVTLFLVLSVIANVCASLAGVLPDVALVMPDIARVLPEVSPVRAQIAPLLTCDS